MGTPRDPVGYQPIDIVTPWGCEKSRQSSGDFFVRAIATYHSTRKQPKTFCVSTQCTPHQTSSVSRGVCTKLWSLFIRSFTKTQVEASCSSPLLPVRCQLNHLLQSRDIESPCLLPCSVVFSKLHRRRQALTLGGLNPQGRWRGRRPRARRGGSKRRSAEVGVWGGAPQPLPSLGIWGEQRTSIFRIYNVFCTIFR